MVALSHIIAFNENRITLPLSLCMTIISQIILWTIKIKLIFSIIVFSSHTNPIL